VDAVTRKPLLDAPYLGNVIFDVTITSPLGPVLVSYDPETPTNYNFSPALPDVFGLYHVTGQLTVEGINFGLFTGFAEVDDIRPSITKYTNWLLIVAVIICSLLLLTAYKISQIIRKKEIVSLSGAELESDYKFHGKLSIYAIILNGGDRDIRPFDFNLQTFTEKRISLRSILDSVGANDTYAGSEDVMFIVGPEESIVVRNNSKAVIKSMGRSYDSRSKLQLFYGQKLYIIFEKDENELEIAYRKAKTKNSIPISLNIRSDPK
jgi:hypothetical protein